MDDNDLRAALAAHKAGSTKFTRRMAINLADFFDVSVKQIVSRLEEMGCIKQGAWEWFQRNGGFTKDHYAEVRRDRRYPTDTSRSKNASDASDGRTSGASDQTSERSSDETATPCAARV